MEHVPPFLMDPEIPTDIQVDMTNGTAIKSYATTGFKYHIYIYGFDHHTIWFAENYGSPASNGPSTLWIEIASF